MNEELTLDKIKDKICIFQLANDYGFELKDSNNNKVRAKNNLIREEKTSSIDFFKDTQKFYDRGTGSGGDVFDLVQMMENISPAEAIQKVKEMVGEDNYSVEKREYKPTIVKEKKEINFNQLKQFAIKELIESKKNKPFIYEETTVASNGYKTEKPNKINITTPYRKLLEVSILDIEFKTKINTLFSSIIGYSTFWQSPSIILTDRLNNVVDIVSYRPKNKETGDEIVGMKYYYKNQNNRGDNFVYPFEKLVKFIANREKYIVVGEGLKNSVNALLYGVPFISLESTESVKNIDVKLIEAINDFRKKGFGLVGGFDGDGAGAKAFLIFISNFKIEHKEQIELFLKTKNLKTENYILFLKENDRFGIENLFEFDSDIDLTNHLVGEDEK